ncbi:MAG: ArnT family glycosyltransferase [Acidiferrobacterales bacterium]
MAKFWSKVKRKPTGRRKRQSARKRTSGIDAIEDLVVEEIEVSAITAPRTGPKRRKQGESDRLTAVKLAAAWVGLWMLPVLAALFARSPWPVDETRTLAVAWEMWLRGNALVPYLNGDVYPQPPLMFLLINLGWGVFGVNEWWPRLVPALFGLANLFLIAQLARYLWPRQVNIARYAPLLMLGMLFWAFYLTLSLGDMLLVFFTLLGALAIYQMRRRKRGYGWILLGLVLGIAPLASGLGIFLYLAPLALTAPLWANSKHPFRWGRWYGAVGKAFVGAGGFIAVWAFALSTQTGPDYVDALLAAPLPGPALALFSVERPWWWYLAMLAVVTLPWSIFPLIWMRLWHIRREKMDSGLAFCLFWAWPVIIILSLLSIRQPQFLLPLLPAFALGMAYLLLDDDLISHGQDSIWSSMAFPLILLGGLLAAVPGLPRVEALPAMLWEQRSFFIGIAVAGVGVLLAWLPVQDVRQRITNIAAGGVALLVLAILGIGSQFDKLYETNDLAYYLADAERQQRPVAHVGPYHGQFHFAGRLRKPLDVIAAKDVYDWSASHPQGLIITYTGEWQPHAAATKPAFEAAYRDQRIRIWKTSTITAGA